MKDCEALLIKIWKGNERLWNSAHKYWKGKEKGGAQLIKIWKYNERMDHNSFGPTTVYNAFQMLEYTQQPNIMLFQMLEWTTILQNQKYCLLDAGMDHNFFVP